MTLLDNVNVERVQFCRMNHLSNAVVMQFPLPPFLQDFCWSAGNLSEALFVQEDLLGRGRTFSFPFDGQWRRNSALQLRAFVSKTIF